MERTQSPQLTIKLLEVANPIHVTVPVRRASNTQAEISIIVTALVLVISSAIIQCVLVFVFTGQATKSKINDNYIVGRGQDR